MTFPSTYITSLLYLLLICCGPAQTDVSLRVLPDRYQFFKSESISLSCEEEGRSVPGWSVRRHTSKNGNGTCNNEWGETKGASCNILLYPWDSGAYWCQSDSGDLSDVINILISGGDVFLESPVLPVMEGSNVTLRCWSKDKTTGNPTSDLQADFYTNGSLISAESTGQMTIHNVNKSDEGFYKCNISDLGESAERWMEVKNSSSTPDPTSESAEPPLMSLPHAIIHVLVLIPWVVSTILYISILRDRARARAAANARRGDINDVIMEVAV